LPLLKNFGHTEEEKTRQNVGLDFRCDQLKIQKNKKTFDERNGESDRIPHFSFFPNFFFVDVASRVVH
jgi:hypothetical protein